MDSKRRSVVKALTWRCCAVIVLAVVSYLLTYNVTKSLGITIIFNTIQTFLYFVHERFWNKIHWGRR
jgi:adenylylsulfate kinase